MSSEISCLEWWAGGKPAKISRCHPYEFVEAARKMAVIGKTAGQGDLGQRQPRRRQ
jgi:hypothetical protein